MTPRTTAAIATPMAIGPGKWKVIPGITSSMPRSQTKPISVPAATPTTDPAMVIYQQLLKRKRREEYRDRVNELLGTSPTALSRLPEPAHRAAVGPKSGPNSLLEAA